MTVKAKNEPLWQVYFTQNGSLVDPAPDPKRPYSNTWDHESKAYKRVLHQIKPPDQLYYGILYLKDTVRGRSGVSFRFEAEMNAEQLLIFRVNELEKALKRTMVSMGMIRGTFKIVKQGSNYSLSFISPIRLPKSILFTELDLTDKSP